MKNNKFKNLYQSFTGQIDYCNFIETYGEDYVDFSNTNFDMLQAQFCGFYLTLLLDEYLVQIDKNNYTTEFIPEFINQIVSMIAIDNGKGYTVGDLSYRDATTVLVKLRHKLAHGDFIIKNNEIIFEENNAEGRVNLDLLKKALTNLEDMFENYFLTKPRCKAFNYIIPNGFINADTEENFDKLCNNSYRIELIDTPIEGTERDINYTIAINYLYDSITKLIRKHEVYRIPELIYKKQNIFIDNGINIEYLIKRLPLTDCYKKTKEKYMANLELYKVVPTPLQLNIINNISYRMNKGRYQKFNVRKGLLLNIFVLGELKKNPNYTLTEIVDDNPELCNLFMYHIEDIVVSSYLVAFNSLYEYGLETEATKKGYTNFVKIYNGEQLDFSKFNLEKLYDPNMTIEHNCNNFEEDISIYEKKSIDAIDKKIKGKMDNLQSYLNGSKDKQESKINSLTAEVENAKKEKEELVLKIQDIKLSLEKYDKEQYTKNINIIYHIRNAIAHGNIFVDSYSDDIQETGIIIRDYYNEENCYEKKLKVKDFVDLFLISNVETIYDFIANNVTDEKIIIDEYMQKLKIKSILNEKRNINKI